MRGVAVWIFVRLFVVLTLAWPSWAGAQSLGTFRWQLQPYCNVVTVQVTANAGVYSLEGYDDQCGAPTRAPVTGAATPNPDGTIGLALHVVTAPGGRGVDVEARIEAPGFSGPWTDSEGNSGTFALNAGTGGNPRPLAETPIIPATIRLQNDGGFLAGGAIEQGAIPASGNGVRMMWYPAQAAFRAGLAVADEWDAAQIGRYSAAFGVGVRASGDQSFAAGSRSSATGSTATAFGYESTASGSISLAAGTGAIASGRNSVAIGGEFTPQGGVRGVLASGASAIAIGAGHDAAGRGSVVLGSGATTTVNAVGSFIYGDRSSAAQIQSFLPNEFRVRAAGGTYFFSGPGLTTGVQLAPGASAWSSVSDVNSKEHFRDLDGDDVLAKLARVPIREWNYKAQDASIRHVGPTAQDFHAAFGLGEDPLRISTIDADGIALRAVQALEARTRADHAALSRENAELRATLEAVLARLASLEHKND